MIHCSNEFFAAPQFVLCVMQTVQAPLNLSQLSSYWLHLTNKRIDLKLGVAAVLTLSWFPDLTI